jgi:FKBP-type peptidyl-prolyl cis-trans isomerase FklB
MDTSSKLQELLQQKKNAQMEAGKQFLAENAKRAEVQQTASGLQYEILQAGTGNKPGPTTMVTVHYEGKLIDGTVFDSSFKINQPATFGLHQVIPGWTEGVQLMNEGATFRFYIPYELGYGARGAGGAIPPYATLIFDVQLIKVG